LATKTVEAICLAAFVNTSTKDTLLVLQRIYS
jgi:hypothetical protein